jgi:hypothetical protein
MGEGFELHSRKDLIAETRPTQMILIADGLKLLNNINMVLMGLKEMAHMC